MSFPTAACLAQGRAAGGSFAPVNTLGIVGAYSWDSSHILMGVAERRKLVDLGVSYNRRLMMNRIVNWQYSGELLPVALESDPKSGQIVNQTAPTAATYAYDNGLPMVTCGPQTVPYSFKDPSSGVTYSGTTTLFCTGRQWTMGEAISPIGFKWNLAPLHKTQLFAAGHGGYMYSTSAIPVPNAGSFNFTFDLGVGIERFYSDARSIRVEYKYHHISNAGTAAENPGIDSGLLQVTYCFRLGRR